jgi:hypothetical protein
MQSEINKTSGILGYKPVSDDIFSDAARRCGVTIVGHRAYGLARKSAGAAVADSDGRKWWLRVSGLIGLRNDARREAEADATGLEAIPKPKVIRVFEWYEQDIFWRASLMTLAPSPVVSPNCWLWPGSTNLQDAWFDDLRNALDRLQLVAANRFAVTPDCVRSTITTAFGQFPNYEIEWRTCHGDLHWSNLTCPT